MKFNPYILLALGLILFVYGTVSLRSSDRFRHNQNTFAIRSSGYGQLLARLSQDTVNKVWHYGIEGVNPHDDHDCTAEGCDHDRDHEASYASSTAKSLGRDLRPVAALEQDHHDHDDHGHDHHADFDPLGSMMSFVENMRVKQYQRTNPHGLNEAHKAAVAQDIEKVLLRSYRMDPTDYGVYNAYYLFLTVHEYRATPVSKEHARRIAELTIGAAQHETESPFPWLTAASASLDLFFLDQQAAGGAGSKVSPSAVARYRQQIHYCLNQYQQLRERAFEAGRWESVGEERREEAESRFLFIQRASAQFDALIKRSASAGANSGRDRWISS
ncbi:MAG: hypothetical protein ACI8UO_005091 [Verrucomicrobiales bacterium]|jgi:hypothetical protein